MNVDTYCKKNKIIWFLYNIQSIITIIISGKFYTMPANLNYRVRMFKRVLLLNFLLKCKTGKHGSYFLNVSDLSQSKTALTLD